MVEGLQRIIAVKIAFGQQCKRQDLVPERRAGLRAEPDQLFVAKHLDARDDRMHARHLRRQRHIETALRYFLGELGAERAADGDFDAGIGRPEAREDFRQEKRRIKIRAAKRHAARDLLAGKPRIGVVVHLQQLARIGQQHFAVAGEARAAQVVLEQGTPDRVAQAADLKADRRLGPVQPPGYARHTLLLHEHNERAHQVDFERASMKGIIKRILFPAKHNKFACRQRKI